MEKKNMRKAAVLVMAGVLAMGLTACGSNGKESSGDGKLVFQIWDAGQKAGMEKLAEAYMEEHPDVKIEAELDNRLPFQYPEWTNQSVAAVELLWTYDS